MGVAVSFEDYLNLSGGFGDSFTIAVVGVGASSGL